VHFELEETGEGLSRACVTQEFVLENGVRVGVRVVQRDFDTVSACTERETRNAGMAAVQGTRRIYTPDTPLLMYL
jgi:hypothetical protein